MASLYFGSFESAYRILHAPSFWREYKSFWDDQESVSYDARLRILLVVGLGSSLYEHHDSRARCEWRDMAGQWTRTAQAWLAGPLKKDRLSLGGLQIHCLTILARQVFSIGGGLIWVSMGSLIHEAMRGGLHRDPKRLPSMPVLEAELRRRIWATILELTAQASLDSGMAPRIAADEYDTEPPSNLNDVDLDDPTRTTAARPRALHYTDCSVQLALLDSLPTRLRVLRDLNGLQTSLSYTDALALGAEITEACRSNNVFMRRHKVDGRATVFCHNLLDYLVRRFLLSLHCPFATRAQSNPLFYGSVKASLDAATAIISPEPDSHFSRLMAIGDGQFKESFRAAIMVVGLELLVQVKRQNLDGTIHRSTQYRNLLSQTLGDMIALSAERIRLGETNVKSHVFLNMILAQAEAMAAGSNPESCELAIARSARESLVLCREMLQALAEEAAVALVSPPATTDTSVVGEPGGFGGMDWNFDLFMDQGGFPL